VYRLLRSEISGTYIYQRERKNIKLRISRNPDGSLSFLDRQAGLEVIADMPLYEVDTGKSIQVKDIYEIVAHFDSRSLPFATEIEIN
jgi:hypothetical protein